MFKESAWKITYSGTDKSDFILNGNRFLQANGYLGFRGIPEECKKEDLCALNLGGVYDQQGKLWRESINLPNPFYTVISINGESIEFDQYSEHSQTLNYRNAIFSRKSLFYRKNVKYTIISERFLHIKDYNILAQYYQVKADAHAQVTVNTGLDCDVWSINGNHFKKQKTFAEENGGSFSALTNNNSKSVSVCFVSEAENIVSECQLYENNKQLVSYTANISPTKPFSFVKYVYVGEDINFKQKVFSSLNKIKTEGYLALKNAHIKEWEQIWENADVEIIGNTSDAAALRYSIYQLLILAPKKSGRSIAARGLSGQVYKGAVFWDTEIFMLPFFTMTDPETAKKLILYRISTLDGARRKAKKLGYKGAFYAWESQDSGDEACSKFNITDVFTNRPIRTHFDDKQIHISGDIVYAILHYVYRTGDLNIMYEGAAEVVLECARFLYSYGVYLPSKNTFEFHSVIGPDEYHENVNNNAFTNHLAKYVFNAALSLKDQLEQGYYTSLIKRLNIEDDLKEIKKYQAVIKTQPEVDGLIEQFDGYFELEDTSIKTAKGRLVHPNEYWGGTNGVAGSTQIIKQADVITMLYLFSDDFDKSVKKRCIDYYSDRTEHGSSLSACMYGLVNVMTGDLKSAYRFFRQTSRIDLTGKSKQYAGNIYIGGTHPAANGGAYMLTVFGFAGLGFKGDKISINPTLPMKWKGLKFKIYFKGKRYSIKIGQDYYEVKQI